MLFRLVMFACALTGAGATAQPLVDGTRDDAYGEAIAVQTVETGFGNATDASGLGTGGELNAAYAVVADGRLFVMLTGNIENSFNKLNVFIDAQPGGESTLSNLPEYDFENVSRNFGGLTFDSGFTPELHLYARWGSFSGNVFTVDIVDRAGGVHSAVRGNGAASTTGAGAGVQSGVVPVGDNGLTAGPNGLGEARTLSGFLTQPLAFGFNNTGVGGVSGGTGAADPAAALFATTGFEFSIALADLGGPAPGDVVRLHAAYGNSNHNFYSNQTLPGLPAGTGNLGGNGAGGFTGDLAGVDFRNFAGDQFVTITVPAGPGDFNADGRVDAADYTVWRDGLGEHFNISDYGLWRENFGGGSPAAATVDLPSAPAPEPGAVALAVLASATLGGRRWPAAH
ncbi:MAG: hypothetical protein AAGB00_11685 [Planctomycetota bacterium]